MIKSIGTLRYSHSKEYGWRLVLDIDPGISMFYRSLIPKWYSINSQAAKPHITIIRRQRPNRTEPWGRYEGEKIEFQYDPYIHTDGKTYWWLNCYSARLEEIAEELGMELVNYIEPVKGYKKVWHTTIANMKQIHMAPRKRKSQKKSGLP